jgi:hypothetical protein
MPPGVFPYILPSMFRHFDDLNIDEYNRVIYFALTSALGCLRAGEEHNTKQKVGKLWAKHSSPFTGLL